MLQVIRDRAQGVFAWIIVGMISVPFALWGINSYFGGGGDNSVAEVDGAKISDYQLQNAYQRQRDRLTQMFGGKLPENLFSEETLKKQALDQLIEKELLIKAASDNGMRIGNLQLADIITSIDAFYVDGKFNQQEYERALARQGMSPKLFENRVRRDLLAAQMSEFVRNTEIILPSEVDAQLVLQQQQRDIGYMVIAAEKFSADIDLTEDEMRSYYETNASRFMQPERVKIDYLELKADEIASGMSVTEEEVRQRYESQKINFRTPEERKASHILLQTTVDADEAALNEVRAKAEALLQRINDGEDFAELAKAESQDPGSARNGGDLGFFGRGVMDAAFEEATFALQKGQVSGVVRSNFGFHIIKLEDIRGGETKPYETVAKELKREMQLEMSSEIFFNKVDQLASLTYEQPDTLAAAAEQLQLQIKSSDFFTRSGGSGIAAEPKISGAAFSEDVLARGNNSESLELSRDHIVVLRINEHEPETVRPFDEVKSSIVESLKGEKGRTMALDEATEAFIKLQAGDEGSSLARAQGVEWKRNSALTRDNNEIDRTIVQAIFRMPHPQQGSVSHQQLTMSNGDQALVTLYSVADGDSASADEAARDKVKQQLELANTNLAEQALINGLRERAEIVRKQ
ncbi:MAG: SurA N-terminal domain-containing protein [Chromatiales bacterium]|nr:SurA N-terminal domain-containing protein [Chromatiales bacterium]